MSDPAIRRHNETVLRDLKKGDMVEFPRGLYSHWAVYIGNNEVIHLTGDPDAGSKVNSNASHVFSISGVQYGKAIVKRDNFFKVAGDSKAKKNNDKDQKATPLDKNTIVKNARDKIGEIGYNFLWKNCEYFASWCRYGDGWSQQTIDALIGLGLLVGGIVAVVGAVVVAKAVGGRQKEEEEN